jgi:diguanylate cyclase (GGDEF)-like protein
MNQIEEITRQVLLNLKKEKKDSTPLNFYKEFCAEASRTHCEVLECDKLNILFPENSSYTKSNNYLEYLIQVVTEALFPSVALYLNNDLDDFVFKLQDNPSLIFEKQILDTYDKFTDNRFEKDRNVLQEKTTDIAKLVIFINDLLNNAIVTGSKSDEILSGIKEKINSIDVSKSTKEEFQNLQVTLLDAASDIQTHIKSVNESFKSSQSEVDQLKFRVHELEDQLKQVHKKTEKDFLTQTFNRRAFEDRLKTIEQKYERLGQNYAVVFFDLDHFKHINDTYGHEGGDVILKTFASILIKLTREIDIVARYGGEEFISLIHYKDTEEIFAYVSRVKNIVSKHKFIYNDHKIDLTFSAGLELRSNCNDATQTVVNADKLLYNAKSSGRNKIILWNKKEL